MSKWILTKDRIPETVGEAYYLFGPKHGRVIGWLYDGDDEEDLEEGDIGYGNSWETIDGEMVSANEITHWMEHPNDPNDK